MEWIIVIIGSGLLAFAAYALIGMLQKRFASNPILDFRAVSTGVAQAAWSDKVGNQIARQLPISLDVWESHLRWAQRGGKYTGFTIGSLTFMALALGMAGILIPLMNPAPAAWTVPFLGFAAPFVWVRSAADKVRRRTVRQLPELAALVAAEISANAPVEGSLERAAQLPGPLSGLLTDAVQLAQSTGRPLLSHESQRGALREVFESTGVPAVRAFAVQLDIAASKGVEVDERMVEISKTLAAEYRQQLLENIEKLETSLTTAVTAFYFVPMVLLILLPLFSEAMNMF